MPFRDVLLAALVIAIWGFNFVVIKLGVAEFPPFLLTALRFSIVGVLVAPFFLPSWRQMKWILLLSFTFGTLHFGLLFYGMSRVDGGTGAILVQLGVPFSTLLAVVFLGDRLGLWRTCGLVVAFLGAAVLAGEPRLPDAIGFVTLVVCAFAWAVSNLLVKRVPNINPLALTGWMSLLAAPQTMLWSALFESGQWAAVQEAAWQGWFAVLYTSLAASIVAYSVWYGLLARHEVSKVVPMTLVAPVMGVVGSVLVLGEPLTWHKVLGGVLTLGGVGVILFRQGRRKPVVPPEAEPARPLVRAEARD